MDLTDTELIDLASKIESRLVIDCSNVKWPDEPRRALGWSVSGAGLGGAYKRSLREALTDFFTGLTQLSQHDRYFERFADLIPQEAPE